ncbi:unnamed protein product [Parascedosporium putredinis]|uniref:Xanthan lyase n=1 Tax=Parascedosporium putredinis TaxID=1442378 RepID=A0A9P1H2D7_9PEZI|nr:unnamed protein product [Parascedosporium putredinis]CAI7993940.1 unnamed protein product [Parascedosporium putredinis]
MEDVFGGIISSVIMDFAPTTLSSVFDKIGGLFNMKDSEVYPEPGTGNALGLCEWPIAKMDSSYDIVVYGSTSGAVATSIQAARLGRSVALVSPQEHIGGIQINGLGATDIDNQVEFQNSTTLGGINLELHQRISRHYGRLARLEEVVAKGIKDPEVWRFEPRVAEKVIADWLAEHASITVIKSPLAERDAVTRDGVAIKSIRLLNGRTISGKIFIEASYEGDFLAAAGISWARGREASAQYNESLAGVRSETLYRQIDVDVDPYVRPGDASSGLLYGISDEPFGQPGDGDLHLQSYSYRLPLTDDAENRVPFTEPEGYDPAHYELHRRFIRGRRVLLPAGALSTDLLGMNDEWPVASYEGRRQILKETATFTKGLLWFISTDPDVPHYRKAWSAFGYCRDEFPDNDHFPYELYVRDARRMVSDYIITESTATCRDHGGDEPLGPRSRGLLADRHAQRQARAARRASPQRGLHLQGRASMAAVWRAVRLEHQFYAIGQAAANACDIALRDGLSLQDDGGVSPFGRGLGSKSYKKEDLPRF